MRNLLFVIIAAFYLMACAPQRNLVYFSNLSEVVKNQVKVNEAELKLQKNDLISVTLNSLNTEYDALFNGTTPNSYPNAVKTGFRVNNDGYVKLPRIGDVKVEGLNLEEAQNLITKELSKQIKNPIVNLQLINFKITVIGEVNNPSSLTVTSDQINLLEALGMAGDMTVYGKRENVLVIRETDGQRNMVRLNLNDKDIFQSPYFQLKQNDIVYVEPDKSKEKEFSPNNRALPIITACISAVAVLITALIR
ncbi:polysaccharide biosynthesis/export family protein [Pedobacter nyackensis]|uniref:Polysaccharide export outer membrane protein n=1 Tax=Pedobacter nyackensis TaxID=475255 RepID=A0A1W2DDR7_9SPHI|nr:polysaccharide biosynthesis/export family protein [Pedobacter nyackensis]SMC95088.1 polysaccharide export outer membrane protein [Pedobacter nyackensis]